MKMELDAQVAAWFAAPGLIVDPAARELGDWTGPLSDVLWRHRMREPSGFVAPGAACWTLEVAGALPLLSPLPGGSPENAARVWLPVDFDHVPIQSWVWLRRVGVARAAALQGGSWIERSVDWLLADSLYRRRIRHWIQRISPGLRIDPQAAVHAMARWLARANATECDPTHLVRLPTRPGLDRVAAWIERDNDEPPGDRRRADPPVRSGRAPGAALHVVQYIGSLSPGGAERQLCNLALGLVQDGDECAVRTAYPLEGAQGHYRRLLSQGGIEPQVPQRVGQKPLPEVRWDLVRAAPWELQEFVASLASDLVSLRPDCLHAWLDHPNVIGGLAALAADVPAVLLSTRNSNPTHFPRLYSQDIEQVYRVLARSRRVHWLANSRSGARSYADWLGISIDRFHIVPNGLFRDHFAVASAAASRGEARMRLDVGPDAPVVVVVNRLSEEKQPELMLKVVSLLRRDAPGLRVFVAGSGPLDARLRAIAAARGLESVVTFLGRVSDVAPILCAADALLLTSTLEGCPNVVLEAQHMGLPVVATAGGGTVDAVIDGKTGFLCGVDDAVGLALALRRLLRDPTLRARMGAAGKEFVDRKFGLDQMVQRTRDVYEEMLDLPRPQLPELPRPHLPELPAEAIAAGNALNENAVSRAADASSAALPSTAVTVTPTGAARDH